MISWETYLPYFFLVIAAIFAIAAAVLGLKPILKRRKR